jgi:hypothetical protein
MHLLANLDLGGARSAAVNPMNLPGDSYHRDTPEPATETFERLRNINGLVVGVRNVGVELGLEDCSAVAAVSV